MYPSPSPDPNPWRRLVEVQALVREAMRMLGPGWKGPIRLLDQVSDNIYYSLDGVGYNSWEYERPMAGRHEKASPWPGKHTRGAGGPAVYESLRRGHGEAEEAK